jgi:hypothetical protein
MPQARFIAEADRCEVFGMTFERHEWTDVGGLEAVCVERLAGNPTFEFRPNALPTGGASKKGKAA